MSKLNSKIRKITAIPLWIAVKKVIYSIFKTYILSRKELILTKYLRQYSHNIFPEIDISNINFNNFKIFDETSNFDLNRSLIEDILDHNFDILGTGKICINITENTSRTFQENQIDTPKFFDFISQDYKLIDWHQDFKSNYKWSIKQQANKIKIGYEYGVDIKVPWELARLHHLLALSLSYGKFDEEFDTKILNEYQNQLIDFIGSNTPYYGVNWVSPMEVAIRSINIIASYSLFSSKGVKFSEEFHKLISDYLYISGIFIYLKREWSSGLRNNHYFCNMLGLMFIAKCFKEDIEMNKIGNFAKKEFLQEINFQFNKDGSNFEGSLSYHFFVLEMLYFGLELLDDESIKFIKDYETIKMKIQSIIEFSSQIFGSNHFYPQIGDNDSGKIFDFRVLSNFHQINIYHNYLNICLKRLINDVYKDNMINHLLIKEHKHLIYKDIGLFIYKNEKFNLWISFGRNSQNGKGGHNHLDAFSFVLQVNGKEIITDPGTFAYTSFPDKRNIFRSAISHNCLYYPEMDTFQTENPEDLFWLQDKTCNSFIEEIGETIFLKLERLADNYNLKRTFEISKDKIILTDEIPESLIEKGEIGFHLHPSIHDKISVVEYKIEIQDYMNICFDAKNKIEIMDYEYSPGYGKIETSKKIVVSNLINTCHFEINIIN